MVEPRRLPAFTVERVASARLPTAHGRFTAHVYREMPGGLEHVELTLGDIRQGSTLVRIHSECLTGDVLCSVRCDCGAQLALAQERIARSGSGVVVYMRGHEGRGIGLADKLRAYALQDDGADTIDANLMLGLPVDARRYGAAARILVDLGVRYVRLMTNNPAKLAALEAYGIVVAERIEHQVPPTEESRRYLEAKRRRLGHLLARGERTPI
jgi:3,4-dihydroxy 2-butanone 4-phosphate synthase/GTP cyclohydrolase II